jgi:hypothetical protein
MLDAEKVANCGPEHGVAFLGGLWLGRLDLDDLTSGIRATGGAHAVW